jgi:hypothetical protein
MGRTEFPDLKRLRAGLGWKRQTINEREMALFSECSLKCGRILLDTADVVREAISQQIIRAVGILSLFYAAGM